MVTSEDVKRKLLLVEDDEDFSFGLSLMLKRHNFECEVVSTLQDALASLEMQPFDAILLDLSLPDATGVSALSAIHHQLPRCPILVLTGHNDAQLAVQALRLGAQDYLTKPIRKQELLRSLDTVCGQADARRQWQEAVEQRRPAQTLAIGDSRAWTETLEMIQAAASAPKTTILLTGEPGVGKEVAARLVHHWSARAQQVMLAVNVAGLPGTLLESELFGHEAGAFTGARSLKRGLFEQAEKGTLFLDEIGELPLELQSKLLRVLEGQPFRRLGGEKDIVPQARLISATNRPLADLVQQGLFREDLYHRLKVLEVRIPPLRERVEDIEKLAMHFLARLGAEMGYSQAYFSLEVLQLLLGHAWPGNVRELRNVVERALVLSRGEVILPHHLPRELRWKPEKLEDSGGLPRKIESSSQHLSLANAGVVPVPIEREGNKPLSSPSLSSKEFSEISLSKSCKKNKNQYGERPLERESLLLQDAIAHHILRVVSLFEGNVTRAAEALGVTRQTLRRKLRDAQMGQKDPEDV